MLSCFSFYTVDPFSLYQARLSIQLSYTQTHNDRHTFYKLRCLKMKQLKFDYIVSSSILICTMNVIPLSNKNRQFVHCVCLCLCRCGSSLSCAQRQLHLYRTIFFPSSSMVFHSANIRCEQITNFVLNELQAENVSPQMSILSLHFEQFFKNHHQATKNLSIEMCVAIVIKMAF